MLSKLKPKGVFARNVVSLITGTSLAQAIPMAISPILTRIYSPEDFGLVAIYVSLVAILSIIATGRYELAVTLPVDDVDAANVVSLAMKICAGTSALLLVVVSVFGEEISKKIGNVKIGPWLYLLPVSVIATSGINIFQLWCNRKSQYRRMSINRVQTAAGIAAASVLFGVIHAPGGLIFGNVIGQIFASGWIGKVVKKENQKIFSQSSIEQQMKMARRYASLPLHIAPAQLIGTVAMQIPLFIVNSVYSLSSAGLFSMAYRLVSLPTGLIAEAIGSVYRQRIAAAYNETGEFRGIFLKTIKLTAITAVFPFAVIFFIAPDVFAFILGANWRIAGDYARILVVGSYFQFVFTPIDKGALVVGATKYIFSWHLARLIMFVALFFWTQMGAVSVTKMLWVYVFINSTLYLVEGVAGYIFSKGHPCAK